jgi:hypothetical protein
MRYELLVQVIWFMGFTMMPLFSGFGIVTSWPNQRCIKEIWLLKVFFRFLLPRSHFSTEPMIYKSKNLVVFIWRKDDSRALAFIEENRLLFGAIYRSAEV